MSGGPLAGPLASSPGTLAPAPAAGSGTVGDATQPSPLRASSSVKGQQGRRLSQARLLALADGFSARERQILQAVSAFRLLRADQLRRLFFHEISTTAGSSRVCRRSLARLTADGVMRRLERRVGGSRAGSSGHVYTLTAAGRRVLAYWEGSGLPTDRGAHEPGAAFVQHTLAVAELYVALVEADRAGELELLAFEAEPACWRPSTTALGGSATLKPDALVRVGSDEYDHVSFVEIDCGTVGRGALLRKTDAYLVYYRGGREQSEHGVFPRVVWITTTASRTRYLAELAAGLPEESRRLFVAGGTEVALDLLAGNDSDPKRAEGSR